MRPALVRSRVVRCIRCLGLLVALGLASAPSLAHRYCPDGGPIRYAHYEFGFLYSVDTGTGVDEEIRLELQRRTGCAFVVNVQPRARTWSDLKAGELDMAGSGVQTAERDTYAWFAHYVLEKNYLLLSDSVDANVKSLADFELYKDLRIGAVRSFSVGPTYDAAIERMRKRTRVYEAADITTLFRMFEQRRFDAFVASQFLWAYYLQRLDIPMPKRVEDWDSNGATPSGLVLSKKRFTPAQSQAWSLLVQELIDDGTVERIVARFLGAKQAAQSVYRRSSPKSGSDKP